MRSGDIGQFEILVAVFLNVIFASGQVVAQQEVKIVCCTLGILRQLEGKKVTIQRSKGLGENDPEMMWMTTMNPETRRLIKVMPEDAERTAHYFDVLLGDALNERKNFIAENGAKYLELADIS